MYEYLDRDPQAGDVVESLSEYRDRYSEGTLYIVNAMYNESVEVYKCDNGYKNDRYHQSNFKVLQTAPGSTALIGDTAMSLKDTPTGGARKAGDTYVVSGPPTKWKLPCDTTRLFPIEEMVVVKRAVPQQFPKYKIGDTIRIGFDWYKDQTVTITDICKDLGGLSYHYQDADGRKGNDSCTFIDASIECYKIPVGDASKKVFVLDSHGSFVVGEYIVRTSKSMKALPEGYVTKLVGITQDDTNVYLKVIDTDGNPRPQCGIEAWTPVPSAPKAPVPPSTYDAYSVPAGDNVKMSNLCDGAVPSLGTMMREHFHPNDSADTANTTTTKETTMPTTDIKITVNGKDIPVGKHPTAACLVPKTDLEAKKPYALVKYDPSGKRGPTTHYSKEIKAIKAGKAFLQSPSGLGCTIAIHKEIKVLTTNVPVVEVK